MQNLYDISFKDINGEDTTLKPFQNKVLLIVNVASKCGFTPQYQELETLYRDYKAKGFSILGFPCDQFRHQEPGSNQEIKQFAESCFQVTFPIFAKLDVKGKNQAPLYQYLKKNIQKRSFSFIPWNFTKILVDNNGNVIKRFLPTTSFAKIRKEIEGLF